jgi:hypothetical protein
VRDVDAIHKARDVDAPILVGWSSAALVAAHRADRNLDRVSGSRERVERHETHY